MNDLNRRDFLKCAGVAGSILRLLDASELLAASKKSPVASIFLSMITVVRPPVNCCP